jgi:hypothetical protein
MIVKQSGLPEYAFLPEAQTLGNCAALFVALGAVYLRAIQAKLIKRVVDQSARRPRDDPFALKAFADPVAYRRLLIRPIDLVKSDCPGKLALVPQAGSETFVGRKLLKRAFDKFSGVFHGSRAINPGEPFSQVVSILIRQSEHAVGVMLCQQPDFRLFIDLITKHQALPSS